LKASSEDSAVTLCKLHSANSAPGTKKVEALSKFQKKRTLLASKWGRLHQFAMLYSK
jgi:hypothetical protein